MIHTITNSPVLEIGIVSIVIALLGVVVLIGKGDWLIAGYNTANKEKKAKVNIKRLRWLVAIVCWLTAVYSMLMVLCAANATLCAMLTIFFVIIILLFLILANTWAKNPRY